MLTTHVLGYLEGIKEVRLMALKGLRDFIKFDAFAFLKDKQLLLMQESPLKDYDSGKEIGVRLKVVIWTDDSKYS